MLKLRLQGTEQEIKWFKNVLLKSNIIKLLNISEPYANKGTNKYFRVYADIEKSQ